MKHYLDEIPLYAAGKLNQSEAVELEKHLTNCPECQAELAFWQSLAGEIQAENTKISAPDDLAERALIQIHSTDFPRNAQTRRVNAPSAFKRSLLSAVSLLQAQAYIIKREIWPASAGIMALGVSMALISKHAEAISFIAPLVAAACLAVLYGPDNDPVHELALATPTSTWKVLLARLSIISGYNLLLSLLASVAMLLIIPPNMLGVIILGWLAPMALLSSLALLLSIWIGSSSAIVISYSLWMIQYVKITELLGQTGNLSKLAAFMNGYQELFQSPGLQLVLAAALVAAALISAQSTGHSLRKTTS